MTAPSRQPALAAGARSPFQSQAWLQASGALRRSESVRAGDGSASVNAWLGDGETRLGRHYFHDPRSLLTGVREQPLLARYRPSALGTLADVRAAEWGRALLTISPYGYRGGPVAGDAIRSRAAASLAGELLDLADDRGASLLLSHYLLEEEDEAWIESLVELGGVPLVMGADAVLDIRWREIEDYHAWLGKSRRSLRGRAERGEPGVEWTVRRAPGLDEAQRSAIDLLERQAADFDPEGHPPSGLLSAVATGRSLPRILLMAAEPGAPPRSALAVLEHGDSLYPKFFGTAKPRADYFPLVYTRLIGHAISHGWRRIEYGGGSHRAKLFRGARLRLLLGVLVVRRPSLRKRVLPLAGQLSAAKLAHFRDLSERWHVDHAPVELSSATARLAW